MTIDFADGSNRQIGCDDLLVQQSEDPFLRLFRNISSQLTLFRAPSGEAFAMPRGSSLAMRISDQEFSHWIRRVCLKRDYLITDTQVQRIGHYCAAQADGSPVRNATPRLAIVNKMQPDETIYLRLNATQLARVNAEGFRIVTYCPDPILPGGSGDLPIPLKGADASAFDPFFPGYSKQQKNLVLAWLLACLRPGVPVPMLSLLGPRGTGKSTTANFLMQLIDPGPRPSGRSDSVRDLSIRMINRWMIGFDNRSVFDHQESDELCRAITGQSYEHRRLYSDTGLTSVEIQRPTFVTALSLNCKPDLVDRMLVIQHSKCEHELSAELELLFEERRPYLLGFLLRGLSAALRGLHCPDRRSSIQRSARAYRMADFISLAAAAADVMPWSAQEIFDSYRSNRETAAATVTSANPVVPFLKSMLEPFAVWKGTASQLLDIGENSKDAVLLPSTPEGIALAIRRSLPELQEAGIEVNFRRAGKRGERIYTLRRVATDSDAAGVPRSHDDYDADATQENDLAA